MKRTPKVLTLTIENPRLREPFIVEVNFPFSWAAFRDMRNTFNGRVDGGKIVAYSPIY